MIDLTVPGKNDGATFIPVGQIMTESPLGVLNGNGACLQPFRLGEKVRFHAELADMGHENMPGFGKGGSLSSCLTDGQNSMFGVECVKKARPCSIEHGACKIKDIR